MMEMQLVYMIIATAAFCWFLVLAAVYHHRYRKAKKDAEDWKKTSDSWEKLVEDWRNRHSAEQTARVFAQNEFNNVSKELCEMREAFHRSRKENEERWQVQCEMAEKNQFLEKRNNELTKELRSYKRKFGVFKPAKKKPVSKK